jgi:hypothetical protein
VVDETMIDDARSPGVESVVPRVHVAADGGCDVDVGLLHQVFGVDLALPVDADLAAGKPDQPRVVRPEQAGQSLLVAGRGPPAPLGKGRRVDRRFLLGRHARRIWASQRAVTFPPWSDGMLS